MGGEEGGTVDVLAAAAEVLVPEAWVGGCSVLRGWVEGTTGASTRCRAGSGRLVCLLVCQLVGTVSTVSLDIPLLRTEGSAVGTRFAPPRSLDRFTLAHHLATTTRVADTGHLGAVLLAMGCLALAALCKAPRAGHTTPPLLHLTPDHPAPKVCALLLHEFCD